MKETVYEFVDGNRLRDDILATGEFGQLPDYAGLGRTVHTGTEANKQAREYLVSRLEEAGLDVHVDAVGNITGRWVPNGVDPAVPAVATGSHLDSVTAGGIFDGVLGVYAALEAIRAMQMAPVDIERPLEVVSFTEEEGSRFSDGVLGSSVAVGDKSIEAALSLTDADGVTLKEALDAIGFLGEDRIDAAAWDSWLELHVEQSTRLEKASIPVGIVTDITGTIRCHVEISGEANHAGTTSMTDRTDALSAASELVLDIESSTQELVTTRGDTVVGTVGQFNVEPNAINVIPGKVTLGIDIRDVNYDSMESIVTSISESLTRLETERGVMTTFEQPYDIEPIEMNDRCITAIRDAASKAGIKTLELHSGAGHDTMLIAKVTAAGMIFAPSRDGISHSPKEWTDWSDCTASAQVLAESLSTLANH